MVNSVDCAFGHSQFLSGKEIGEYINELAFANLAAKKKIYARYVHSILNLDCQCKLETKDVELMEKHFLMRILQL